MIPKVSIIIPSYNHEKYIDNALSSVVSQTYTNIEIIVVDDGSTDNSCNIISQYSDSRIILIKQENQGAHNAINRGLKIASGEYVAILNSDDLYFNERIYDCVKLAMELGIPSMITSYIEVIDSDGRTLGIKQAYKNMWPYEVKNTQQSFLATDDPIKNLLMFNYVATTSNFFFHKSIIEKIGYFYSLRYVHDWDYLLRISQHYPIHIIEKPLLKYRVHPNNTIRENQSRMILEICWILAINYPNVLKVLYSKANSETDKFELYSRLYHSIQTFGCEKVFVTLLLIYISSCNSCSNLKNSNANSLELFDIEDILQPENNIHKQLITEIEKTLNATEYISNNLPKSNINWKEVWNKIARKLLFDKK